MSLYAYDIDGFIGDVASIKGWQDLTEFLRHSNRQELIELANAGYTEQPERVASLLRSLFGTESMLVLDGDEFREYFNPNQARDWHGRWTETGMSVLDRKIVDFKTGRPLAGAVAVPITTLIKNARFVPYTKMPFYDALNKLIGVDPASESIKKYVQARNELFRGKKIRDVPLDYLVATQPVVNKAKVERLVAAGFAKEKPILAVRFKGRTFIIDGHHHTVAAVLRGDPSIPGHLIRAKVLNLDKKKYLKLFGLANAAPDVVDTALSLADLADKAEGILIVSDGIEEDPDAPPVQVYEEKGEEIPLENLTPAMHVYAAQQECVWRTVNGRPVCIRSDRLGSVVPAALRERLDEAKQQGYHTVMYHGTAAATPFEIPHANPNESNILDRMLGAHYAADPEIASRFASPGRTLLRDDKEGGPGRVMPFVLKGKGLTIEQRNPAESMARYGWKGAVKSDQDAIASFIAKTVFERRKDLFVDWVTRARSIDVDEANRLYDVLKAGKGAQGQKFSPTIDLSSKWSNRSVEDFVSNYDSGLIMLGRTGREAVVKEFKSVMRDQGITHLRYENTSPMETAKPGWGSGKGLGQVRSKRSFVVLDESAVVSLYDPKFAKSTKFSLNYEQVNDRELEQLAVESQLGYETLYVKRRVLNANQIIAWAKANGFETTLPPEDMHVTVAYSRELVNWMLLQHAAGTEEFPAGNPRLMRLGDDGEAVVLAFESALLADRWQYFRDHGASWDYDSYHPHITLTYNAPKGLDLDSVPDYTGPIVLGPEEFEPVEEDWAEDIQEYDYNPSQPRMPKGTSKGGQWIRNPEAELVKDPEAELVKAAGSIPYITLDSIREIDASNRGINTSGFIKIKNSLFFIKVESEGEPKESPSEVAAWKAAKVLGWMDIVRPAILTKVIEKVRREGKIVRSEEHDGVLQKLLPRGKTLLRAYGRKVVPAEIYELERTKRLFLYEYVIGALDRHAGNYWIDSKGRPWSIDLGRSFSGYTSVEVLRDHVRDEKWAGLFSVNRNRLLQRDYPVPRILVEHVLKHADGLIAVAVGTKGWHGSSVHSMKRRLNILRDSLRTQEGDISLPRTQEGGQPYEDYD